MLKKYVNVENLKVVGDAGYRIGKDIVREGTKAVIGKAAGAVIGVTLKDGFDGIKNMKLDTVLGDITRMEKKKAKKLKKELRKQERISAKDIKKKAEDLKDKVEAKIKDKESEEK